MVLIQRYIYCAAFGVARFKKSKDSFAEITGGVDKLKPPGLEHFVFEDVLLLKIKLPQSQRH